MATGPLHIDGIRLRDNRNREVTFRGINVAGDSKFPRRPDVPSHVSDNFFDGDSVSFVGRPFTEEEAHHHFGQLKRWGYNVIRYIFTWEALEHEGPGKYDEEFVQHTIKILRIIKSYGMYVFMDPHQDVWSRFTAGSGAPMWTLYAAGLDPKTFAANQAALVQNTWPVPAEYPKMLWPTNYQRLAAGTMFTLFYSGKDYAPNAILNGQNIQDYLTDHFIDACKHLAERIHEAGDLENDCIIGWETMNEPNRGFPGWQDLSAIPHELKMKKGTCPTPIQSFLTGSGRAVEIDTYDFGSFGPYKSGTELVDPRGISAWIQDDTYDKHYGFNRDPGWKLGECLWAQNGVWDPKTDQLIKKDYFARFPGTDKPIDYEVWSNTWFMSHFRKYRDAVRSVHQNCMILMESAVLEIPPSLKGTPDDEDNLIFASHYYDGLTLLTKHWNRYYNIDVFGVLRGKYSSPAFAIKLGETAIRNCLRDQLQAIRQEGMQYTGERPTVFTEIGIPYDMDDKYAYKTADYASQIAALDANHFALEGSGAAGYTLWAYVGSNNHQWGDNWNGEDLSIFSVDDQVPLSISKTGYGSTNTSSTTLSKVPSSPQTAFTNSQVTPNNLKHYIRSPTISRQPTQTSPELMNSGLRAAEAFIRPSPIATHGDVTRYGFNLRYATFSFSLTAPSATPEDCPTQIYLPDFHFPTDGITVEVTGGKWHIETHDIDGQGMQTMKWWHGAGEQTMTVKGRVRKAGGGADAADHEPGYFESMRRAVSDCTVM